MGIAKKCTKNDTITGIFNKCPFLGSGPDRGRSPVEWGKRERKREREKERDEDGRNNSFFMLQKLLASPVC